MSEALTQDQVDRLMHTEGVDRYRARALESRTRGKETETAPGNYLLQEAVNRLEDAIRGFCNSAAHSKGGKPVAYRYLRLLPKQTSAFITAKVVIDCICNERPFLTTAYAVASSIEDEARFAALKKALPQYFKTVQRQTKRSSPKHRAKVLRKASREAAEFEWAPWGRTHLYALGTVLIELMERSTGLIETKMERIRGKGGPAYKRHPMLRATQDALNWLTNSHTEHEAKFPLYLPTVEPPRPWENQWAGGYSANTFMRWPLVKGAKKMLKHLTPEQMPEVYSAVNTLQETPWRINDDVFQVFDYFWGNGIDIGILPSTENLPLPSKPLDIDTNEEARKDYRAAAAEIRSRNLRMKSKRVLAGRLHFIARQFRHQPFFYPYKMDWRGRMYPIANFLNPQGEDLAKALLEFDTGHIVDTPAARDWLAIHGANKFGVDKCDYAERIQWVEDNRTMIQECGDDPLGTTTWIHADSPWEFLAFCFDWAKLLENERKGVPHFSHTPVAMDGSNNGLQLFSLLLRDPVGAEATNVSPSPVPQDIYQRVADHVTAKLQSDPNPFAWAWLEFAGGSLPRTATKRSVMTLPYGATKFTQRQYVEDWFYDVALKDGRAGFFKDRKLSLMKATIYLAGIVWDSMGEIVVAAQEAMHWLQQVARIAANEGVSLTWESPTGLKLCQHYQRFKTVRIKTKVGDTFTRHNANIPIAGSLNSQKQASAISPNFIHSLDAAVLVRTVNRCAEVGISDFAMVHDSYAVPARRAPELARAIREVCAELFSGDLLEDFRQQITAALPAGVELPPPPTRGSLDPNVVLQSDYFFA